MFLSYYSKKYGDLDPKVKQNIREVNYRDILVSNVMQLFKYTGIPKTTADMLEIILIDIGFACLGKNKNGDIVAGFASLSDGMDADGLPIIEKGATVNGEEIFDPVLIRNNVLMRPEMPILSRMGYQLAKVDFAQYKLVQKSICNPIPLVDTEQKKEQIKLALRDCGNDDIFIAKYDKSFDDENNDPVHLLDVTNVAYSDKFKYLSAYHDDLTRRAFFLYGIATQSPTKQAQTNDGELEDRTTASRVYVGAMLDTRQTDLERAGIGITVDFNPLLKELYTKNDVSRETIEQMEGDDSNEIDD